MKRLLCSALLLFSIVAQAHAQAPSISPPARIGGEYTGGCNATRPLPIDATAISWSAAYDVCALSTKWLNGKPLFDIVVGGNTYTIKSVNGFPDVRKLAGLLGVSPTFGTAGVPVSTWYDQSGNANNCTQSTSANRFSVWLINGRVSMAFDGFLVGYGSGTNADKYCVMPSGVASNSQSTTVYSAYQMDSAGADFGYSTGNVVPTLYTTGATLTNGITLGFGIGTSTSTGWSAFNSDGFAATGAETWIETGPTVAGIISSATNFCATQNSEAQVCSGTALTAQSVTGGAVGAAVPPFSGGFYSGFYGRMYDFMIAGGTAASSTQQTALKTALAQLHGISQATPKYAILVDGASLDVGTGGIIGGINGYGYIEQMLSQIPYPIRMGNTAVYGATTPQIAGTVSTSQCNFFQSGYTNILIAPNAAAGNDINDGSTAAQAFTNLQTYLTDIKACTHAPTKIFVFLLGGGIDCVSSCTAEQVYNNDVIANAASLGITPIGYHEQCAINGIMESFTSSNTQYFNQSPSWLLNHPKVVGYQNYSLCPLIALQSFIGP